MYQLIVCLNKLSAKLGRIPTTKDMWKAEGCPSPATFSNHFGSWKKAIKNIVPEPTKKGILNDELLAYIIKAEEEFNLDLSRCVVIGDRWSDMLAADRAGLRKILVKTGAGIKALNKDRYKWQDVNPDYIAENILEAVKWLLN